MPLKLLTTAKEEVLELLFPIKCAVCEKETGGKRKNKLICTDCLKELSPSFNFYCPLCEARTSDGKLCFSCQLIIGNGPAQRGNGKNPFYLDRLLHPFSYKDFKIQKIIKAFKYRFIKDLEVPLGRLMIKYLNKIKDKIELGNYIILPVPLHKRKFNQRGYNQSELLAVQIAKFLSGKVVKECLLKTKSTKDQAQLKEGERIGNLKNVFVCQKPESVSGKNILLVDDVYTTGATMAECARILKEAGAKEIIGLTIARG